MQLVFVKFYEDFRFRKTIRAIKYKCFMHLSDVKMFLFDADPSINMERISITCFPNLM